MPTQKFVPLFVVAAGGIWGVYTLMYPVPPTIGWPIIVVLAGVAIYAAIGVVTKKDHTEYLPAWLPWQSFAGAAIGLLGAAVLITWLNPAAPSRSSAQGAITVKLASPFFLHDPGIDLQNTTNRKVIYEVEELTYAINGEIKVTIFYDKPHVILAGGMTTVSPPKAIDISAYPEGKTVGVYLFLALKYGFEDEGPARYLSVQRLCDVPQIPNQPVDCRFRKRDNDFLMGD